jgi:hypothetical protein
MRNDNFARVWLAADFIISPFFILTLSPTTIISGQNECCQRILWHFLPLSAARNRDQVNPGNPGSSCTHNFSETEHGRGSPVLTACSSLPLVLHWTRRMVEKGNALLEAGKRASTARRADD